MTIQSLPEHIPFDSMRLRAYCEEHAGGYIEWHTASIDECPACLSAHNKLATASQRAAAAGPGSCRDCGAYGDRDKHGYGISCGCAAE